tara:strand:+ start:562 stop:1410 length:849 start_codon:yes stop_codon:yes gene_type:complete
MNLPKQYLIIWLLCAFLFALILGATNYVIDPLKYYHTEPGTREITGFEQSHKVWQVKMRQPDTLVLGNSRNLYGFDVSQLMKKNAFNYSFPGPSIEEVEQQFDNVLYSTNVNSIFLVVDGICSSPIASKRDISFLFSNKLNWLAAEFLRAKYLISLSTVKSTFRAFGEPVFYDNFGRRTSFEFGKQSGTTISERVKVREGYALKNRSNKSCSTDVFERLLVKAYSSGISIALILNPIHNRYKFIQANKSNMKFKPTNMRKILVEKNALVATPNSDNKCTTHG